jgi:hypothetical protein
MGRGKSLVAKVDKNSGAPPSVADGGNLKRKQVTINPTEDIIDVKENAHHSVTASDNSPTFLLQDAKCLDTVLNGLIGRRLPAYFSSVQEAVVHMTGREFTMVNKSYHLCHC